VTLTRLAEEVAGGQKAQTEAVRSLAKAGQVRARTCPEVMQVHLDDGALEVMGVLENLLDGYPPVLEQEMPAQRVHAERDPHDRSSHGGVRSAPCTTSSSSRGTRASPRRSSRTPSAHRTSAGRRSTRTTSW